jgi:hypothetical protein
MSATESRSRTAVQKPFGKCKLFELFDFASSMKWFVFFGADTPEYFRWLDYLFGLECSAAGFTLHHGRAMLGLS